MTDGKSPSAEKSTNPLAYSSFTAGPAPRKKVQRIGIPSALNSCSSSPFRCIVATALPETAGRLPMPTPGQATRITDGASASAILPLKISRATTSKLSQFDNLFIFLPPSPEIKERERAYAPGRCERCPGPPETPTDSAVG